ncbi:Rieske Fe-S protein [Desulfosporosinus acidiphilus SJ4]|uniref:Rieske Fe-S protein n=1 Tax=Desulfosporosinus acidiphilus (strain DSM 22704 / JCM 16185 / SJ4) TaxID=646529 RepID=I4D2B6_DESAJ|nr:ubiquinol-cytochrome c reductase iron-sulfur subunit [Desulfosporosinus acidiphilus]AFM39940.1 Rieske Fe-S protein [Desulfosporosinus acidiphilus SJ4]
MNNEQGKGIPRRRFLAWGAGSVGAVIGLSYVGLLGDFLNPPAANAEPLQEVGRVSDFEEGTPKFVTYKGSTTAEGVYVVNLGSEGWLALDFHCTHLQCGVNYVDAVKKYICPCHGGVYDLKGQVLSGPPPKNLPRRVIQIQGDSVMVGGIIG